MEPPTKRRRVEDVEGVESGMPESLSRPISPPQKRRHSPAPISSPWHLTWVRDLPEEKNRDAVSLKDLLGDPLISDCWEFNYLHDIDFLMDAFDADTKHLVKVHVVHGFWKHEDTNRLALVAQAAAYDNVSLHVAPMPEMFGTHHSKMMVLFRHDDTAQIIIHTANMISKDWTNMTNAVWKSPQLPKLAASGTTDHATQGHPLGGGERFKSDLLSYLRAYDRRRPTCKPLVDRLAEHDFSGIKAVLVGSVPGQHDAHDLSETPWGWPALKRYLRTIPSAPGKSEVVVQVSSIATLGPKDTWLRETLFEPLAIAKNSNASKPTFKVVYPTADEIRRSLDGYSSGASIHTKIQSAQQAKQLQYLRPIFHHWANDSASGVEPAADATQIDGGRNRAAPHIKTYIRYNENSVDWALLTSANLSKQAWGEAIRPTGVVRIASWEIGVLVWPGLFERDAVMMPTFLKDMPDTDKGGKAVVGVRVPYSVPLQRYSSNEVPWVATLPHTEPDWMGQQWGV